MVYLACLLSSRSCSSTASEARPQTEPGDGRPCRAPIVLTYVALGDSYRAAPLVPVTDVANGCFRSSNNYPSIVAKKLGAVLDDRRCGGARTVDFRRRQFPDVPPQLSAVKPDVDLVTIGVGGNDAERVQPAGEQLPRLRARDPEGAPCQEAMRPAGTTCCSAHCETGARVGRGPRGHGNGPRRRRCWWSATPRSCRPTTPVPSSPWPRATTRTPSR